MDEHRSYSEKKGNFRLSRRRFLTGCAAFAGAAGIARTPRWISFGPARDRIRVRILYALHGVRQDGPDWPNKGFDFGPAMDRINNELGRRLSDFVFLPAMANGPEQAQKIIDEDKTSPVDGYLVYQMNCWNRVAQTAAATGKPVLYADFQYGGSGGFLFIRRSSSGPGRETSDLSPQSGSRTSPRRRAVSPQPRRPGPVSISPRPRLAFERRAHRVLETCPALRTTSMFCRPLRPFDV